MFILKALYCRLFQSAFYIATPILPYREPKIVSTCKGIGDIAKKEGIRSVLIVTDKGIVNNGLTKAVEEVLSENNIRYAVYDETQPNPTVNNVEDAIAIYKANECNALIAIGGGSAMDCAKGVGVAAVYPGKAIGQKKGLLRVLRRLPTFIAIPTTAGTGSEVTPVAIITDSEKEHKYAIMSFPLIPHYAVLDAALTYSMPPHITATTGIDALTHAVEAYIGRSATKETKKLALEAARLIFENVETAYSDGKNHMARENMLHAAYKAGIAFSKSYVGYIHAVAHSLGGKYKTPHGLANAVIMPYFLKEYGETVYKKLYELAATAGVAKSTDTEKEAAEAGSQAGSQN